LMTESDSLIRDAAEIGAELLEPAFDRLIDLDVIKEIPILGTAVRVASAAGTLRDRLFAVRLRRFVTHLGSLANEDVAEMLYLLKRDKTERERVGTTLLFTVERLDDLEKAELLAKAFRAYLRRRLTLFDFRRTALAITDAFVDDLQLFIRLDEPQAVESMTARFALMSAGITQTSKARMAPTGVATVVATVSEFGVRFWKALRENLTPPNLGVGAGGALGGITACALPHPARASCHALNDRPAAEHCSLVSTRRRHARRRHRTSSPHGLCRLLLALCSGGIDRACAQQSQARGVCIPDSPRGHLVRTKRYRQGRTAGRGEYSIPRACGSDVGVMASSFCSADSPRGTGIRPRTQAGLAV